MAAGDPIRVMVVDDHEDVRFIVGVILGDHSDMALVVEAASATDALAAFDGAAPDVALVDARMPITDGYELSRKLLERRPDLPIAILTAHVDDDVRAAAAAAGVHVVASKADFEALPELVRELSRQPGAPAGPA
jgi:two-component system, NarL family, response regulator DevR